MDSPHGVKAVASNSAATAAVLLLDGVSSLDAPKHQQDYPPKETLCVRSVTGKFEVFMAP
jgi:hypothetical protein